MFVFPITIAPAAINFFKLGAVVAGRAFRRALVPAVVGNPAKLMLSFATMAKPASGGSGSPLAIAMSSWSAAVKAWSGNRLMKAFRAFPRFAQLRTPDMYSRTVRLWFRKADIVSSADQLDESLSQDIGAEGLVFLRLSVTSYLTISSKGHMWPWQQYVAAEALEG
jgi:hypothetical protein